MRLSFNGTLLFNDAEIDTATDRTGYLFDDFVAKGVRDDPYYPGDQPFLQGLFEATLNRMAEESPDVL